MQVWSLTKWWQRNLGDSYHILCDAVQLQTKFWGQQTQLWTIQHKSSVLQSLMLITFDGIHGSFVSWRMTAKLCACSPYWSVIEPAKVKRSFKLSLPFSCLLALPCDDPPSQVLCWWNVDKIVRREVFRPISYFLRNIMMHGPIEDTVYSVWENNAFHFFANLSTENNSWQFFRITSIPFGTDN